VAKAMPSRFVPLRFAKLLSRLRQEWGSKAMPYRALFRTHNDPHADPA